MHAPALVLTDPTSPAQIDDVRAIFLEYQRAIDTDLCFQSFEAELASLPSKYARPRGRLYLGVVGDAIACCGALRPHDATTAEMKRLYVRPPFRGAGYGKLLAQTLIDNARAIGYRALVLDTLPTMQSAQTMYAALGFRDIEPYTHNPVIGVRFMGLVL